MCLFIRQRKQELMFKLLHVVNPVLDLLNIDRYVLGRRYSMTKCVCFSSSFFHRGLFTPPVPRSEMLPKPEPSSPRSLDILEVTEVSTVTTVGMKEEDVTSDLSAHSIEPDLWLEPPPYGMTTVSDEPKAWKEPPSCEATTIFEEPKAWMEPPSYEVVTSPKAEEAPSRAMLEAFHQFQHNPAVQVRGSISCLTSLYLCVTWMNWI